jgi:hypothetical protein
MASDMRQMEGEKFDLSIEVTFVKDKLKQARDESEARMLEADNLKLRIAKATQVTSLNGYSPHENIVFWSHS